MPEYRPHKFHGSISRAFLQNDIKRFVFPKSDTIVTKVSNTKFYHLSNDTLHKNGNEKVSNIVNEIVTTSI